VLWFTANSNGEAEVLRIQYRPRPKLKKLVDEYNFADLAIKGRASRGNVVTSKNIIQRITLKSKGVSTLAGKRIWLDEDIVRLNDAGRGRYLGEFSDGDLILVICKDGSYYTTSFDLSTHFQGDLMRVEKFDPDKTVSVLYYDGPAKAYYIKRFNFEPNNGIAVSFVADGKGSRFIDMSEDRWPQLEVSFKGKNAGKEPERIDVDEFIGKKGFRAKGKKVSSLEVKNVVFVEPLVKEEPEAEEPDSDAPEEDLTDWSNPSEPTLF
jgi:topoisomerase-4 subunit A